MRVRTNKVRILRLKKVKQSRIKNIKKFFAKTRNRTADIKRRTTLGQQSIGI